MKYMDIKQRLEPLEVFSLQDIYLIDPDFRQPTLYDWVKQGKVRQLRQNRYVFSDFSPQDKEWYFLANALYTPSYVSLETALNHYSLIPETTQAITSISTRKTKSFTTPLGTFHYQSILEALYFGYQVLVSGEKPLIIASLEKAILDHLYLHTEFKSVVEFEEQRWNRTLLSQRLDWARLETYLSIFDNQALSTRIEVLRHYVEGT